jgi:class 3 adenylate cyclase
MIRKSNLFIFILFYYQLNDFLKYFVYKKYDIFSQETIIFSQVVISSYIFILFIFFIFTTYLIIFSKIKNYTLYALSFIYIKYISDNIIDFNTISIYQYEFRRVFMWLFTTPLILKLYCDMNNLKLLEINTQYHIISNVIYLFLYIPFTKNYKIYIVLSLSLFESYFIYKLSNFNELKYTKFIIYTWALFSLIHIIEIFHLFKIQDIQFFYILSDMIAKLTTIVIINDYEEQIHYIKDSIDLQSISLLSDIKKYIIKFEETTNITHKCKLLINNINSSLTKIIPLDKTNLKLELLKKILPLDLEDKFLTRTNNYIHYNSICVLFTDIVSYTELAKKYDAQTIFKLLNEVYTTFDEIVKKYKNLQKIETIGDAYMVVGDIHTNDLTENIVKNIILLAYDLINAIKNIKTPNNDILELRIGISIGKAAVGILGFEIPRLCIVGNVVNVASRLQSITNPDTIHISTHVYEFADIIDFGFEIKFNLKEKVYLKNLGTINTYVITP